MKIIELLETAKSRSDNYAAFALWFKASEGVVLTCQIPPADHHRCEEMIAAKFGIDYDTLHYDIFKEYENEQYGINGVQSIINHVLKYVDLSVAGVRNISRNLDKQGALCHRFLTTALNRAKILTSRSVDGDTQLSACSGSISAKQDIMIGIFVPPTQETHVKYDPHGFADYAIVFDKNFNHIQHVPYNKSVTMIERLRKETPVSRTSVKTLYNDIGIELQLLKKGVEDEFKEKGLVPQENFPHGLLDMQRFLINLRDYERVVIYEVYQGGVGFDPKARYIFVIPPQ